MTGALSVLGVGVALMDMEGRILACDEHFALNAGRPIPQLIGVLGGELARPCDRNTTPWLAQKTLQSGDSFTVLTRRADGANQLYENHVVQLFGGDTPLLLTVSRACHCRESRDALETGVAGAVAAYAADMAKQMAGLAASAHMPITVDLFMAAATAAEMEGGVEEVRETAA